MFKQTAHESSAGAPPHDPHWQVLSSGGPHMLLVPAHDPRIQRESVEFFITHPLRRWWAHTLLGVNRVWPGRRLLPSLTAPALPRPIALADPSAHTALQIGTPGPYQKASMLITGEDGAPIALSKIALKASADPMLQNEARWLRELNRHPTLSRRVPRLLAHGTARGGRHYLLLSIARGRSGTNAFTPAHAAFLYDLSRARTRHQEFAESPAYHYMADSLARLHAHLPPPTAALLAGALGECGERLRRWQGPFVLAHGDFTPWNLRRQNDDIVVFDWEYAEEGAIALRDICHFLLIPRVLAWGGMSPVRMAAMVHQVGAIVRGIHPQSNWEPPIVAALVLGCLLHTALFYAASRGYVPRDDIVIKAYCRLIQERTQWMG
jgi:Phosphotransferase enzyme family